MHHRTYTSKCFTQLHIKSLFGLPFCLVSSFAVWSNFYWHILTYILTYFYCKDLFVCYLWIGVLKAWVRYFYQFFFNQMIALQKLWKMLFISSKKLFRSRDNKIFLFLSFPLFLPAGHCFRGWTKINLKVYDTISCLNKNSITHFVWYLENEKAMTLKLLSIK